MKAIVLGIENANYTDKETGEQKVGARLYVARVLREQPAGLRGKKTEELFVKANPNIFEENALYDFDVSRGRSARGPYASVLEFEKVKS